jgi:hypothetical protein
MVGRRHIVSPSARRHNSERDKRRAEQNHGFLSSDITIRDLILNKCDLHHLYPKRHLKDQGLSKGRYNQIANYALAQSEINIVIGDKSPAVYFRELSEQCNGGSRRYGGIVSPSAMRTNLVENCIPAEMIDGEIPDFDRFLETRRRLMAAKLKQYFRVL